MLQESKKSKRKPRSKKGSDKLDWSRKKQREGKESKMMRMKERDLDSSDLQSMKKLKDSEKSRLHNRNLIDSNLKDKP